MATFLEHTYSIVHQDNAADQPTLQELKTQLEKGTDASKIETMKTVLTGSDKSFLLGNPVTKLV